ncbi:MAG: Ulp1 protease family, C-terminal catalytic domain [Bacteroidota bacterium]
MPLHYPSHWAICAINFKNKIIELYDSIPNPKRSKQTISAITKYLMDEFWRLNKKEWNLDGWTKFIPTVSSK